MAGMIFNNYPLLANGLVILAFLFAGFFTLGFWISVFSDDESKGQNILFAFLSSLIFLLLILTGTLVDALKGLINESSISISYRPSRDVVEFFLVALVFLLVPVIFSLVNFLGEEKAKRARIVLSAGWMIGWYIFFEEFRYEFFIFNSPLLVYWSYKYIQGQDHINKFSAKKKTLISFSLLLFVLLVLSFFKLLNEKPRYSKSSKEPAIEFTVIGTPIPMNSDHNKAIRLDKYFSDQEINRIMEQK